MTIPKAPWRSISVAANSASTQASMSDFMWASSSVPPHSSLPCSSGSMTGWCALPFEADLSATKLKRHAQPALTFLVPSGELPPPPSRATKPSMTLAEPWASIATEVIRRGRWRKENRIKSNRSSSYPKTRGSAALAVDGFVLA
jgi:hypothetical protein